MPSRSLEMPSRSNGPPSIWDTHVVSGNVFANPAASSQSPYPGGFNQLISKTSARNSVPQCVHVARTCTIFMPSIDCLLVASSFCPSPVCLYCLLLLFLIPPTLLTSTSSLSTASRGINHCARRTKRSITPWQTTILPQVLSPTSLTTSTAQRLLQ